MADVALSVQLSRAALGLPPLEIAASPTYYCSTQFLGAAVQWSRTQVGSPWVDGQVTTTRTRQMVSEQVAVEVKAPDMAALVVAVDELVSAFQQDSFTLTILAENGSWEYQCEAADYQVVLWSTPRLVAKQAQVVFTVPRQPYSLLAGAVT